MEYKQPQIETEIRRRIDNGFYNDVLPTSLELAEEFGVNVKTVNKVLRRLANEDVVERKRCSGTRVKRNTVDNRLIEVIFEGFASIFVHPFWGEIWSGMVDTLQQAGYRPILNMLQADPVTGLLRLDNFSMTESAGKIVLGIEEQHLLRQVAAAGVPCITGCDKGMDSGIPYVAFDFESGMEAAVDFLFTNGCRRIAFLGQLQSLTGSGALHKFEMFRRTLQKYTQLEPELLQNVRPVAGDEIAGINALLDRCTPPMYSALIPVSYTHLTLPTILLVQIAVVAASFKKNNEHADPREARQRPAPPQ
eukprot:TRINITY_DN12980_c0_g1_i4.p1 TRINITY_DN12980_c0_g1~~TRINITY_DN12980_c0_g1_i4.p1  ORF type:complete len:306 (-),score=44.11 TRINITY_DN12980_c0_g1_i4:2-919(-)